MRIVIVEDEIRTLEGIKKLIVKLFPAYTIVGIASNGKEGLDVIRREQPELVITDIKMPEMDGLVMLTELYNEKLPVKAIVLSAYSEFQYAQKAMKLGVVDYILKPVAVGELTQVLKKIETQVAEQKKLALQPEVLQSLENVYYGILMKNIQMDRKLREFLKTSHELDTNENFILLSIYLGEHYQEKWQKINVKAVRILERDKKFQAQKLCMAQNQMLLYIIRGYQDISGTERYIRQVLLQELERDVNIPIGVSMIEFSPLERLPECFYLLQNYMDWNLVLGEHIVIVYPKINQVQTQPLSYPTEIEQEMKKVICSSERRQIESILKKFQNYFKDGNIYNPKEIKESYIRFLWGMINVAKELGNCPVEKIGQQELLDRIMSAITYEELRKISAETIGYMISQEEESEESYLIKRTKSLIHEYYQQGITLDEIARRLQITPEYLGTLFHKSTGIHFSGYMKEYRIIKAKKLLLGSELKLYEIAERVGYMDPKYFSRVFKQYTGELPAEYRKKRR